MSHQISLFGAGHLAWSSDLTALALVLLVLVGGMVMPVLPAVGVALLSLISLALQRAWRYVVDKIIESIIIALLSLFGGLWILDMLPSVPR